MRLEPAESRQLFAAARVARLATVGSDQSPHLVPCTFAIDADDVAIGIDGKPKASADLRRLRNITGNPRVSLLADHYSEDWSELWWVRADGTARIAAEPDEQNVWWGRLRARYPQLADPRLASAPPGPVIVVAINVWRGWAYSGYPDRQRADGDK